MSETWLTTSELAFLAGISRQGAHKACARAMKGICWRGHAIVARRSLGERGGGKSGTRYEVALSSLPEQFKTAFRDLSTPSQSEPEPAKERYTPRIATEQEAKRAMALFDKIAPATGELTGVQRAAAIRKVVEQTGMKLRTVQRYVRRYNEHGLEGLMRKAPSNSGETRCAVSMAFDRAFIAAGHAAAHLSDLGEFVDNTIAGLWKSRAADAGENDIGELTAFLLFERCKELGTAMQLADCKIERQRVRAQRHFKIVNTRNNDAKAFRNSLPAISRDWTNLEPMQIVIADVKHLDVLVARPDGSKAYPKLVGFMDAGTGRIFAYLVHCPNRRSITQKLVIEAFIAMCQHEHWGLPSQLYLDNGSEFGGFDRIVPALSLINRDEGREIIRAQPYNAQAKPIEPLFARLDRYCFSGLPGYTGGDRVNKKTQNDGREPEAWEGSWDSFKSTVGGLIDYYHSRKVGGQWGGYSPNEILQSKINEGWRPIFARPLALEVAFCERKIVKLGKYGIQHKSVRYWHPEFMAMPGRTDIELLLPWIEGEAPVALLPSGPVKLAEDFPFPANDVAGAVETGRRKQAYRRGVAELDKNVPTIDPIEVKLRMARSAEKPTIPGRTRFLDHGADIHQLAPIGKAISQNRTAERDDASLRRERAKRETERLERKFKHGK